MSIEYESRSYQFMQEYLWKIEFYFVKIQNGEYILDQDRRLNLKM